LPGRHNIRHNGIQPNGLKAFSHYQSFLLKTSAMFYHDFATLTCLGHLGKHDTNRNDPKCVALPTVSKASKGVVISIQNGEWFWQKNFAMERMQP
jgi:hypothetical protein